MMSGWTLLDAHPTHGRTFYRPLDAAEHYFIWGSLCDGSSDGLFRVELHLSNGAKDAHLLSNSSIIKAFLSTKRRYPLAGAILQGPPESPTGVEGTLAVAAKPHFVVRESDLAILRPGEIVFEHVTSAEEVDRRVAEIFDGPRPLSDDLLSQLYVFRETGRDDVLHLVTLKMHCVADVTASTSFLRCFLDMLARGGEPEPPQLPLEERLAMAIPLAEREPIQLRSLSPARRRWRKAAGSIIFQLRMEKIQGGHTLPRRFTSLTSFVPALSREAFVFLSPTETAAVLANCRRHKVTFGNTYLALAQVAMTRVLYRRYLRGELSEEEWEYRRKQPSIIAGPLSLRPYLDKGWFEGGGGGEFMVSLSTFFYQLPFMPLGETAQHYQPQGQNLGLSDGAPPFSELLTFERFLHRTEFVRKQATALFKHPLLLEIVDASAVFILQYLQKASLDWLEHIEAAKDGTLEDAEVDEEPFAPMDIPLVIAHGGSSFGNLGSVLPQEYPLPPTHPLSPFSSVPHPSKAGYVQPLSASSTISGADGVTPTVVLKDIRTAYHVRPGELYLGAWSSGGRLKMYGIYDINVYEEVVVKEWLDELKGAVLWYLGRTHEPCQAQQSRSGPQLGSVGQATSKL